MACDRFQPVRPEQGHQRQAGVRQVSSTMSGTRPAGQEPVPGQEDALPARLGVMPSGQLLEHDRTDRAAANPVIGTSPIHTTLQPHDPKLSLRLFALLLCCDILASVGIRSKAHVLSVVIAYTTSSAAVVATGFRTASGSNGATVTEIHILMLQLWSRLMCATAHSFPAKHPPELNISIMGLALLMLLYSLITAQTPHVSRSTENRKFFRT